MKCIAILPIKERSERVPHKNFRALGGIPLYRWPIETLKQLGFVDKIVLNTDCPDEFTDEDKLVEVEKREDLLCGDGQSMNFILDDIVDRHKADVYLQVHATNPFVTVRTLQYAYKMLREHRPGSIFGVTRHQSRFFDHGMKPINHHPGELLQTQHLPPLFEENSCFYIFERDAFQADGHRICGKKFSIPMKPIEALDIDTEDQWELAEAVVLWRRAHAEDRAKRDPGGKGKTVHLG